MAENKGNPYHDEEGKFTSPEGVGKKSVEVKEETTVFADEDKGGSKPKIKVKVKEGVNLNDLVSKLNDINAPSNVPQLRSARDIENNIEQFFSRQVIGQIDKMFGKSDYCADWQFHPKSNPNCTLEIFPNVLGKNRYKDNHAKFISTEEYYRLSGNSQRFDRIYRGMGDTGEKARNIIHNYTVIDLENFDYYGPNSGNCYGSNVYTTIRYNYADSYARSGRGTLIYGLLDKQNANYMDYYQVRSIMSQIDANTCVQKVLKKLIDYGMDSARATQIAKGFGIAIKGDPGLVAICMGLDFYISDNHQRNLFNLSKWLIQR